MYVSYKHFSLVKNTKALKAMRTGGSMSVTVLILPTSCDPNRPTYPTLSTTRLVTETRKCVIPKLGKNPLSLSGT